MGVPKLIVGIILLVLALFLANTVPSVLNFDQNTEDMIQLGIIILGFLSVIVGALER